MVTSIARRDMNVLYHKSRHKTSYLRDITLGYPLPSLPSPAPLEEGPIATSPSTHPCPAYGYSIKTFFSFFLASSVFGIFTSRTPLLNFAAPFSVGTSVGRRKERVKEPYE